MVSFNSWGGRDRLHDFHDEVRVGVAERPIRRGKAVEAKPRKSVGFGFVLSSVVCHSPLRIGAPSCGTSAEGRLETRVRRPPARARYWTAWTRCRCRARAVAPRVGMPALSGARLVQGESEASSVLLVGTYHLLHAGIVAPDRPTMERFVPSHGREPREARG
jgi:hypothetical protein